MNSRRWLSRGTLLALALLFIGLVVLSGWALRGLRVDLTENHLYTMAPGTKQIVSELAEPVNLYFYWSAAKASQYPSLKTYGTQVQEFLQELAARSRGKLRLHVIDPEPFSEDEDRASELGVRGVPLGSQGTDRFYFGLAGTNSTDGHEAIPFFDPSREAFLEYDVAKLVHQLGRTSKPVVAWLSSLPMSGGMDPMTGEARDPWYVLAQAQQLFEVRELPPSISRIDDDVDVLTLVHPKHLPESTLFAIDQFVMRGGRVLLFVDPLAEQDAGGSDPSNPLAAMGADRSSNVGPLLAAWGVGFDPGHVIGDLSYGLSVSARAGEAPVRHIGILGLDAAALDPEDIVTSGLSSINLATAGALSPLEGATTTFLPLMHSSKLAAPIPLERFAMLLDPATLMEGFEATGETYTFAARVSGPAKSAFPQGIPAGITLPEGIQALAASQQPLNLIVVADTDMLADYLWLREPPAAFFGSRAKQVWAHNGDFVWNALDNLAGSDALISVRGRASFSRPFERVEALRRDAEGRFRSKEQELEAQLSATEQKLIELEAQRGDEGAFMLTPEQEAEIARFEGEKLRIRKELRDVRLGLDQDIRRLGNELKILNIVVVPAIFALVALLVASWRRRRREAILLVQRTRKP